MNRLKKIMIRLFMLVWILPLLFFNVDPQESSALDNRQLTEFPFGAFSTAETTEEKISQLTLYASDRIGFRDTLVGQYTLLNEAVFGDLVHPSYMLGQDGYVFFKSTGNIEFTEYHETFAQMVIQLDRYLKERGVPFIFVFTPEKASVLRDKLPVGMNYNNDWVKQFLRILEDHDISVVDNTAILQEQTAQGEAVFNRQFNAGHWNDLGAFYGVNAILEKMQESFPEVRTNAKDEFTVSQKFNPTLASSSFPINEAEPIFSPLVPAENVTEDYGEVRLDPRYSFFYATANPQASSPRTLVFQGSYMNNMGFKFFSNALSEYIAVHDYHNVLELEYYYERFQPECVIFEVAEYTLNDAFFDYESMQELDLTPVAEELN